MSIWLVATSIVWAVALPSGNDSWRAPCRGLLERARTELLARGFAPTTDGDTSRWLQLRDTDGGGLRLAFIMRSSADGPQTGFELEIAPAPAKSVTGWQHQRRKRCCDDHAEESDHLVEFLWTRRERSRRATVSIVEFGELIHDQRSRAERELFQSVARAAADRCLSN